MSNISLNAFDFFFNAGYQWHKLPFQCIYCLIFHFKYFWVWFVFLPTSTVPMNVEPVIFYCAILPPTHSKYILLIWRSFWQLNDSVLRIVSGNKHCFKTKPVISSVWVTTEYWKSQLLVSSLKSFGTCGRSFSGIYRSWLFQPVLWHLFEQNLQTNVLHPKSEKLLWICIF